MNFVSFAFALTLLSTLMPALSGAAVVEPVENPEEVSVSRAQVPQNSTFWSKMRDSFSVGYFNFTSAPMEQVHLAAGRLETYNYFTFDYRFSKDQSVSLRPVFTFATAGTTSSDRYAPGEFKVGDAYLNFRDRNLALLPFDVKLQGQLRLYAPTSESSRNKGMIARLRPWFAFEKRVTRDWSVAFNFEPDYYFNEVTGTVNDSGKVFGNRHFGYESSFEVSHQITRTFGAQVSVGHQQSWSHAVPTPPRFVEGSLGATSTGGDVPFETYRTEAVSLQTSVSASYGAAFFVLGVSQQRDVARPKNEFSLFRPKETQYMALTSIRF